jgi:hypothetical protein
MKVLGYIYHAGTIERNKDDVIDILEFTNTRDRIRFLGGNSDVGIRIASIHPANDAMAQRIYNNCQILDGDWGRFGKIKDILL